MKYKEIQVEKSQTLGWNVGDKTKYRKVRVALTAEVEEGDDVDKSYESMSEVVEQKLEAERIKFINSFRGK